MGRIDKEEEIKLRSKMKRARVLYKLRVLAYFKLSMSKVTLFWFCKNMLVLNTYIYIYLLFTIVVIKFETNVDMLQGNISWLTI